MPTRLVRWLPWAACGAAGALVLAALAAWLPPGATPHSLCLTRRLLGIACAGCGMTRALAALFPCALHVGFRLLEVNVASVVIESEQVCRPIVGEGEAAVKIRFAPEVLLPMNRFRRQIDSAGECLSSQPSNQGPHRPANHGTHGTSTRGTESRSNGGTTGGTHSGRDRMAIWLAAQGIAVGSVACAWINLHEINLATGVPSQRKAARVVAFVEVGKSPAKKEIRGAGCGRIRASTGIREA